jgi:hypothetical protein
MKEIARALLLVCLPFNAVPALALSYRHLFRRSVAGWVRS